MNKIIEKTLPSFATTFDLPTKDGNSKLFEYFSAYCLIEDKLDENFYKYYAVKEGDEPDRLVVFGSGGDLGIDGIIVYCNSEIITEFDQVEDLVESSKKITGLEFILFQSKTSEKFNASEITNFGYGIRRLFESATEQELVLSGSNDSINKYKKIIAKIFDNASKFTDNPILTCYYISNGTWQDDQECLNRLNDIERNLSDLGLFKTVRAEAVDANRIQKMYRAITTDSKVQISLKECVELDSEIDNVEQVIIGSVAAKDFLTLITENSSAIKRSVFVDNIRDFQGDKGVNQEIKQTIETEPSKFFLFNNGVTVICKKLVSLPRKKYELTGYQIVNGCQTSHVIFNSKDLESIAQVSIPIKIIQTTNEETINSIIKATNHQTPIKDDQLLSLTEYHKVLEDFFKTFKDDERLYYERRSRQFAADSTIERKRIVTIKTLINSVAAMYYDKPHFSSRYYGRLISSLSDKLFKNTHKPLSYYTSSYALYKIERICSTEGDFKPYYRYRYHFLMMLAHSLKSKVPELHHTKQSERFCQMVLKTVNNPQDLDNRMRKFLSILKKYVDDPKNEQFSKSADIVENLKKDTIELYKGKFGC